MQENMVREAFRNDAAEVGGLGYGGVVGRKEEHSRMGIASFVLAIVVSILAFLTIFVAGVLQATTPGGMNDLAAGLVGFAIIGCCLANLVGLGIGAAGLLQRRRPKKVFAILGAIGNGAVVLGVVALIVLGATYGG
jgi:hypothetical protein